MFEHQLTQWRENFCTAISPASREASGAFRELQRQHDQLQRELRRKEKALAEVAALLVFAEKTCQVAAGGRGQMTSVQQRQKLLGLTTQACADGGALESGLSPDRPVVPQCAALAAHGRT